MRRRIGLVSCALLGLLVLAAVPLWFGYRAMRHDRANHALAAALWKGDTSAALAALNEGADPNTRCGREEQIKEHVTLFLLVHRFLDGLRGKRANTTESVEPYALIVATSNQNSAVAKALLDRGADVNAKDEEGLTPLIIAALFQDHTLTELMLKKGADVNIGDKYGSTALLITAEGGDTAILRDLLDKGADINAKNPQSETALMIAAKNNNPETVKLLLDRGADVKTQGGKALYSAIYGVVYTRYTLTSEEIRNQNAAVYAIVTLLLDRGVNIKAGKEDVLCEAIDRRPAVVPLLLERGADINAKDSDGRLPLIAAVYTGSIDMVKLLLDRGAKINARDESDQTALMAARGDHLHDIAALLEKANRAAGH